MVKTDMKEAWALGGTSKPWSGRAVINTQFKPFTSCQFFVLFALRSLVLLYLLEQGGQHHIYGIVRPLPPYMREAFERHSTGVGLQIRPWVAPRPLFAPPLAKSGTR